MQVCLQLPACNLHKQDCLLSCCWLIAIHFSLPCAGASLSIPGISCLLCASIQLDSLLDLVSSPCSLNARSSEVYNWTITGLRHSKMMAVHALLLTQSHAMYRAWFALLFCHSACLVCYYTSALVLTVTHIMPNVKLNVASLLNARSWQKGTGVNVLVLDFSCANTSCPASTQCGHDS